MKFAIIQHVLQNFQIQNKLVNILYEFTGKDITLIFASKLLEDLLRSKVIFKNSNELMKQKVIIDILLKEKEMQQKLQNILVNIMKSKEISDLGKR